MSQQRGHDGDATPFPTFPSMGGNVEMVGEIMQGNLEDLVPTMRIIQNLPLFLGCMADTIEYLRDTGQVEEYRDYLKGRLCEKHKEMAPPDIFDSVPEVLDIFHDQLEEYLNSLDLERCEGHDHGED